MKQKLTTKSKKAVSNNPNKNKKVTENQSKKLPSITDQDNPPDFKKMMGCGG